MKTTRDPLTHRPAEPAATMAPPRHRRTRSEAARRWDKEHQPTSYRLDPLINEHILEIQTWYDENDYRVTTSQIAEDLLYYAIEAWHQGTVIINVEPIRSQAEPIARYSQEK